MSLDRKERLEALPGWSWDAISERWEEGFRNLEEFATREGHCSFSALYKTTYGYRLGQWTSNQRATKDNMSLERKARLEALPGWSWDARADMWQEGFRYLKEFSDREAHAIVPKKLKATNGYRLGFWVSNQRTKKDSLSSDRIVQLEALPCWSWDPFADMWKEGFCHLREFIGREGHCIVPASYKTEDGFRLGQWVGKQRAKKDTLPLERNALLEALPEWSWDPLSDMWKEGFRHLQEFVGRERHCLVPALYKSEDGFRLGQWLGNQRANQNSMPPERKARLEALPGWVWRIK